MVKISYDENDKAAVQVIEDYFWFNYYCDTFYFDIVSNSYIIELCDKLNAYNKSGVSFEEKMAMLKQIAFEIFEIVKANVNIDDLQRFVKINREILFSCYDNNEFFNIEDKIELAILRIIHFYNKNRSFVKSVYKKMLLKKYGDK